MSSFYDHLNKLSARDIEDLDRWVHSRGRLVFTGLIAELSAGLTSSMADVSTEAKSLEQYAMSMAHKSGERKGVIRVGQYLNEVLPTFFKKRKEKESR